jgi:cytochrome c oxidase assembly factor CtaG
MQATFGLGHAVAALLFLIITAAYAIGWRRLHRVDPKLANPWRLLAFVVAMITLGLALIWPLPGWSNYLLAMRSTQKVLMCMIAAPLIWLACPIHTVVWGLRGWTRRWLVRLHGSSWDGRLTRSLTQPMAAWFGFVAAFLLWHDPASANFLMGENFAHYGAPWLLGAAAILFWSHVVGTGPRLHTSFPAWLLIIYLLGAEIANMITGITIAFTVEPIYPHYPAIRALVGDAALPLNSTIDQMAAGALIWVFGSFVYIFGIVFVLNHLFHREGSTAPEPLPNWDSHEKFIAPGLEHRVAPPRLTKIDDRSR